MKKLIIMALAFSPLVMFGQSVERQVIASSGGYSSSSSVSASFTVGETVTATGTSSSIIMASRSMSIPIPYQTI